jgi:hypothetical protein
MKHLLVFCSFTLFKSCTGFQGKSKLSCNQILLSNYNVSLHLTTNNICIRIPLKDKYTDVNEFFYRLFIKNVYSISTIPCFDISDLKLHLEMKEECCSVWFGRCQLRKTKIEVEASRIVRRLAVDLNNTDLKTTTIFFFFAKAY